jgi:tight adherence protein B
MSFDGALALRYIAGVINAGASLDEALRALTSEAPEPLRRECAARLSGLPLSAAERAARLFATRELRLARAALILAHEAGGAVGPLLERCARQLEERRRWAQRRQALSAQTVASAWIVGCMPVAMMAILAMVAPGYLKPLVTTPAGRACLVVALLLMSVGAWMVRRMVHDND